MPKKTKKKLVRTVQTAKSNIMGGLGKYKSKAIRRLRGRGGYAEDLGSSIGSWLGKKAGGLFKSITGLGTYAVTKNSLLANPTDPPILSNTRGGTRIQHREYITDITGSTAFSLTPYSINPGVAATFPWLSGVALNFEEYILHGLVFEFKSTSATALNSTNTALGTVIMATEYNVTNPNFVAKRDMENYVYSTSCSPDVSALHPIECARDINVLSELFIRNTVPQAETDLRFSDIGKFQIATVGMQAAANIGELWATYDIELIKPKLPSAYTSIGPSHYIFDSLGDRPPGASAAPAVSSLFGINGEKLALTGTGNTAVTLDVNTITFNAPGRYLVVMEFIGTAAAVSRGTVTNSATVTDFGLFAVSGSDSASYTAPQGGVTSSNMTIQDCYDVSTALTSVPATVEYAVTTLPSSVSSFNLFIIPLPVGFSSPRGVNNYQELQLQINTLIKRMNEIGGREMSEYLTIEPGSIDVQLPTYQKVITRGSQTLRGYDATPLPLSQNRSGLP